MNVRGIAFGVLCLLQLGAAASGIARHERILGQGMPILLEVAPIDPADPFRGRYVSLAFGLEQANHRLDGPLPHYGAPAYAVLKVSEKGVGTVDYVTAKKPERGPYLRASTSWQELDGTTRVSLPIKRYYMNEALAPAAEAAYRDAITRSEENYARVRILDGNAVIEAVLLNGQPIERAARAKL